MTDINEHIAYLRKWEADELKHARDDKHKEAIRRSFGAMIYAAEQRRKGLTNGRR